MRTLKPGQNCPRHCKAHQAHLNMLASEALRKIREISSLRAPLPRGKHSVCFEESLLYLPKSHIYVWSKPLGCGEVISW